MPNGEGGILKFSGLIHLHDLDREQWQIETARCLRLFASQIESKGLHLPFEIINVERGIFQYTER